MNRDLWDAWKQMPETQVVMKSLRKHVEEKARDALFDSLAEDSVDYVALRTARNAGFIEGIEAFLDGDFVDDEPSQD